MRSLGHIFAGWTRRQNARLAVDLHGIGVDDDAADAQRKFQRRMRLAACGGACDKKDVDGQGRAFVSDTAEIARFEALAEEAMSAIYDARGADVRAALEDARYNIERALDIARMRGLKGEIERLAKRRDRIQAAYDARFKKRSAKP